MTTGREYNHELAEMLIPTLRTQCAGHLGEIEFFRSTRQHGGAATAFSTYELRPGQPTAVLIKLPVGPNELAWTLRLGRSDRPPSTGNEADSFPTPRVFAGGYELGGYDLGWLVMERFPGSPLASTLTERNLKGMLGAAVEFQAHAAEARPVDQNPEPHDWAGLIERARKCAHDRGIAENQRWNEALRHVQRTQDRLVARWESRPIDCWCHGDLHPGNVMRREGSEACVLIDLGLVHPGHWIEDGVYLERLYWGRPEMLHGLKPVTLMAKLRREKGLQVDGHHTELAVLRRVLMAACVPAFVQHEGHPRYTHAALALLEQLLPQAAHE